MCAYLDLFDDFFDYCNQVFFFGNKKYKNEIANLTDEIIQCGQILEKLEDNYVEMYVCCAEKYWKLKYKILVDIYNRRIL